MASTEQMGGDLPIALITGASGGIGRAVFENLATDHYVVGTSTSVEGAASLQEHLEEKELHGAGMVLDLSSPDILEQWYKSLKQGVGVPNVLVNNAGVTNDNFLMTKKPETLAEVMSVNFASAYELMRLSAMSLRRLGGSVLNISSVVAYIGNPGQSAYAASKAALDAAMRCAAAEYKGSPKINSLALGAVETPMFRAAPEEFQEAIIGATELGRPYTTLEVAEAVRSVLFSNLNGQVLHMNSGLFNPNGAVGHHIYSQDLAELWPSETGTN
jgi:3-oxoacyl-[acyl-carrier protein] reductase